MKIFKKLFLFILTSNFLLCYWAKPIFTNDEFFINRLKNYNLCPPLKSPFCYSYKTEILSGYADSSFELKPEIEGFAKNKNISLNSSILFNPNVLCDTNFLRKYHMEPKPFKQNIGQIFYAQTDDELIIPCTFFDRHSDKVILVGAGFGNPREKMSSFLDMFLSSGYADSSYDIIFFDPRGHGLDQAEFSLSKCLLGVDTSKTRLGQEEEKDVIAVLRKIRTLKNYKQIIGLGICYTAMLFAKTAACYPNEQTFSKLILDGCWLSLENFVKRVIKDPKKIWSPQYGGWSNKWPFKKKWCQDLSLAFAQELSYTKFNQVTLLEYLPKIKDIPILFFYGKSDEVIDRRDNEIMWNLTSTEKTMVLTSNPHVINHLKQKELYKLICDLFMELPHDKFIECLQNKDKLIEYEASKIKSVN